MQMNGTNGGNVVSCAGGGSGQGGDASTGGHTGGTAGTITFNVSFLLRNFQYAVTGVFANSAVAPGGGAGGAGSSTNYGGGGGAGGGGSYIYAASIGNIV